MLPASLESAPAGQVLRVARLGAESAQPPCILLHGYPDTLMIWSRLAPLLAADRRVIAFDWPGMGDSAAWSGGTTPGHQARRLLALMDHWGIPRADLVGMDMGGQPALLMAAIHPERIGRVVVMNSLVLGDQATSWEIALLRRYGWNRWLLRHVPHAIFQRVLHTSLPPRTRLPEDIRADLWRCFRRVPVRRFISRLCAGYQGTLATLPASYRAVRCPTLLLWGGRDAHFPLGQAQHLQRCIPHAQLRVHALGYHWMAWHLAHDLASDISAFLAR